MKRVIWICLALVLIFSACGKAPESTPSPSPLPTAKPTPTPVSFKNPLTGLETKEDISKNRPIAIMLNNLRDALPQHGVSQADMIYEVAAEGGITRMMAFYQDISSVGNIGSVRSTRTYYLDIAEGMDAILLHAGGSIYAYDEIDKRDTIHVDGIYNTTIFYRDEERTKTYDFEHSLFTSGTLVSKNVSSFVDQIQHKNGYKCGLVFGASSASNGKTANSITVNFSTYKTGTFDYSSQDGLYRVGEYGNPYIDGNTGKQVAMKNVLVLFARHSSIPNDELHNIEVDITGSGSGFYACNGKYVEITWSKDSYDSQFVYRLASGGNLVLEPGTSYINIVDIGNDVTIK